jgi:hypothetical protein
VAAVRRVEVNDVNGNINVSVATGNEISLVASVKARGFRADKGAENNGYFETTISGDTLFIGRRHEKTSFHFPFIIKKEMEINYELRVPQAMALEVRTVNGAIDVQGTSGEIYATTVNGRIEMVAVGTSEVSAKTVNGHVRAKFLKEFQGAELKTINGSVRAELPSTASFSCDLSQVNGDFEASFPLSIHSNPGSRRVSGSVNGGRHELKIVTVNGDVEVQSGATPPVPPVPPVPAVPASVPTPPAPPAAALPLG